ncbi:MAG: hypothetical protein R6W68_02065 [Ignavibacteriaceae bacterium]
MKYGFAFFLSLFLILSILTFTYAGSIPETFSYRLKQLDFAETYEYSSIIEVNVFTPKEFGLNQIFSIPFNPSTKISFSLPIESRIDLKIFDVLAQEVVTIVNQNLIAGLHELNFDSDGINCSVYLYRIEASDIDGQRFPSIKKMILKKW